MDDESEEQINAESDKLCNTIRDKLKLVSIRSQKSDFQREVYNSISRVPKHLRNVNEKSYEPQIIAIGPYHRVPYIQPHLEVMEEHKIRCLKMLLERTGEDNFELYVKTMRKWEGEARACYADIIKLNKNDFAKMMLFDACFIVEIFRSKYPKAEREDDEPGFYLNWMKAKLIRDLLLVENQLPFFILKEFFEMTMMPDDPYVLTMMLDDAYVFFKIILDFFHDYFMMYHQEHPRPRERNFRHLLDFVHEYLVCEPTSSLWIGSAEERKRQDRAEERERQDREVIRCATELREAGIEFLTSKASSIFHIHFMYGKMIIPRLKIDEDTESFFRNLIVYEQYYPKQKNLIIDYIKFMDCLINTAKDVELLCQKKIIHNCLGDDKVVANMFNKLCNSVTMASSNYYEDIYLKVNAHCSMNFNTWIASLRHNYFNTPWAFISFIAAVLLLLLTLIQTVFSVMGYFK